MDKQGWALSQETKINHIKDTERMGVGVKQGNLLKPMCTSYLC